MLPGEEVAGLVVSLGLEEGQAIELLHKIKFWQVKSMLYCFVL